MININVLFLLQKRQVLEETNQLEPRVSALDDDLEEMETSDEDEDFDKKVKHNPPMCMLIFKCK